MNSTTLLTTFLTIFTLSAFAEKKKVVFLTIDETNHPSGMHEYYAGAVLLEDSIKNSPVKDQIDPVVLRGFPEDVSVFDGAAAIVHYYNGNRFHPLTEHAEVIDKVAKEGCGQIFIHYAVDPDTSKNDFIKKLTGGVYKDKSSANPHWEIDSQLQKHPINEGVKPYKIVDEWYVNIDFLNEAQTNYEQPNVAKQVYAVMHGQAGSPTRLKNTLKRDVKPSENTVFWAMTNEYGGRGAGFTGGHYHRNWTDDEFRKHILNAITWVAQVDIPEGGVTSPAIGQEKINENLMDGKKGGLKKIDLSKNLKESLEKKPKKKKSKKEQSNADKGLNEVMELLAKTIGNSSVDPTNPTFSAQKKKGNKKPKKNNNPYDNDLKLESTVKGVHPYFYLENLDTLGTEDLKIAGMHFEGEDLYVITFAPDRTNRKPDLEGKVILVSGVTQANGKNKTIETKTIVEGLYEAAALTIVGDALYVGTKQQILRFDNFKEAGKVLNSKDGVVILDGLSDDNFHTYTIGFKHLIKNGKTYLAGNFTTAILPGGRRDYMLPENPKVKRGSTFVIGPVTGSEDPKDITVDYLAGGYRTPNGFTIGPDGVAYMTDNQGIFNPSNEFNRINQGDFFGHYLYDTETHNDIKKRGRASAFQPTDRDATVGGSIGQTLTTVHLPQGDVARSPAQPHIIHDQKGVLAPYNGQVLVCEFTTGGMLRIFMEEVDGVWQGVVFKHSGGAADEEGKNGFTGGPNRIEKGPDGNYYIGQIGAGRLWEFNGRPHGLQRFGVKSADQVDPNFNEILAVRVVDGGFELEFLNPVDAKTIDAKDIMLTQWTYTPTKSYGGTPAGTEKLTAKELKFSDDGKKATILVDGLKDASKKYVVKNKEYTSDNVGYVVHVTFDPKANGKSLLYTPEFWYTLNKKKGGKDLEVKKELPALELAKQVFTSNCASCHVPTTELKLAPLLTGILGREQEVIKKDGSKVNVKIDRDYIINAIKDPESEKLDGFIVPMPKLELPDKDVEALADYIISLK